MGAVSDYCGVCDVRVVRHQRVPAGVGLRRGLGQGWVAGMGLGEAEGCQSTEVMTHIACCNSNYHPS